MATVNVPIGTSNSGTNDWSDVAGEISAITTQVNGNLDATNLASNAVTTAKITDANVTDAKLASPNNSVYRTLLTGSAFANNDMGADTYLLVNITPFTTGALNGFGLTVSGSSFNPTNSNGADFGCGFPMIYFDDADYTVSGLTQKLRLRAQVNTNATAWSSVTATFGLYPVTFAGAADSLSITLGTVVSGSTVAIANPGASTTSQGNSGDFTIPSDGQYALGLTTNATLTNNAVALLTAQLQTRNV